MSQDLHDELAVLPGADVGDAARVLQGGPHAGSGVRRQGEQSGKRRSGLGRGLSDLIPSDEPDSVPTHLQSDSGQRPTISVVAIAETADAVIVEVEDSTGKRVSVPIVGDAVESAVVEATLALLGIDDPPSVRIDDHVTDDGDLVVVVVKRGGDRAASAVFVECERPYAVARAVFLAIQEL